MEVKVHLPKLHPKQLAVRGSPAKRKVLVTGRRFGKTTLAATIAVELMLRGRRVLEVAPVAEQTEAFWDSCKRFLAEPISCKAICANETKRLLQMPDGGGRIRTKTAWDADTLRGDWGDLLIFDEYSLMSPTAWDEVGAPMLLDNDGDALFIFSPQRKNHAFQMYLQAIADETGRWAAWHGTSHDNPHLSRRALSEIVADMTDEAYRQEILAEFLDNEGAVFRNIMACMGADPYAAPEQHQGHDKYMGVDWGKQQDFTALSVVCKQCRCEVALDRFNQIDYAFQRGRLEILARRWGVASILAEANAMGDPIIEQMQRDGLPVTGFQTTATSKPPLVENLALCLERAEYQWLDDPIARGELEAYERKLSLTTGRSSYSAPEGLHDDTVMARALALWVAQGPGPVDEGLYVYYDPMQISPI